MATGYAMIGNDGEPFIDTVCVTERGAMVNALVVVFKEPIFQQDDDQRIKNMFRNHATHGQKIARVAIHVCNTI